MWHRHVVNEVLTIVHKINFVLNWVSPERSDSADINSSGKCTGCHRGSRPLLAKAFLCWFQFSDPKLRPSFIIVWWEGLRTAELLLPFPDFILLQLQNRPVYKNSNLLLSVWSMFWKKKPNKLKTTWLYYVNQKYFVRFRQQKQIKLKLKKRLWFGLKHFIFINSNPAHREWPITVTHNPVQNTHQRTLWIQCLK